jgi:CRISPR-associated exonuclease Cas4
LFLAPQLSSRIPVTVIKDYVYCPAIPWIKYHIGVVEPSTPSMSAGREANAEYKRKVAEELNLPRPWRIEVPLRMKTLPISGIVDLVAGKKKLVVVEVKRYPRKRGRYTHFYIQLILYALIVEEVLGPVREAILYMGGQVRRYPVSMEKLAEARRIAEDALKVIQEEEPPRPRQPARKCAYCWYRKVCPAHP